jgi:hypothetical protein
METYPVDIDSGQIVRWIKAENELAPHSFRIAAARKQELQALPTGKETHFGDEEQEDLSEVTTIATLEIAPIDASDGWLLRIVAADEAGPRIADSDGMGEGESQIDLGTFYEEFIRSERGIADVVAEVDSPAAKGRLTRFLKRIERDRRRPVRSSSTP